MAKLYSTAFPVDPEKDIGDLAETAKVWLAGSPHNPINTKDLEGIGSDGFEYSNNRDKVSSISYEEDGLHILGIRYSIDNKDDVWTTDLVGCKAKEFNVSVSVNYHTSKIGRTREGAKKPRIVNDIINSLEGSYDGKIMIVKAEPHWMIRDDVEFIAEIINNSSDNNLPVVYLSRDERNCIPANPNYLSKKLAGMAHVLVEPDRRFSFELKDSTKGRNAYLGAVGLHWPNGMVFRLFPEKGRKLEDAVYKEVYEHSLFAVLPKELTYEGIKGLKHSLAVNRLKQEKHAKDESLLDMYIDDIESKDEQIRDLREIISTMEKKMALQIGRTQQEAGFLQSPQMKELYAGEFSDIVHDALNEQAKHALKDSRRKDVLESIAAENAHSGEREEIINELKSVLKGNSRRMTSGIEKKLRSLGLSVDTTSNHPKIYVPGYENRKVTIAGTKGDHRSSKNEIANIIKYLL